LYVSGNLPVMARNLEIANVHLNGQTVATEPFSILAGELIGVDWIVANLGDEALTSAGNVDSVYFSADNILDESDVVLNGYDNTIGLAAGGSYVGNSSFSILSNIPGGQYPLNGYLIFKTDSTGIVTESDETNNIVLVQVVVNAIGAPDLVVSQVTAPTSGSIRNNISVSWTGKNQGDTAALASGWYDQVYLSDDQIVGNDTLLGDFYHANETGELAAGAEYNATFDVILPTNIIGNMHILVVTDAYNNQGETNEINNFQFTSTPISVAARSDLTVSSVIAPAEANIEQLITVSAAVNNTGSGATYGRWYDQLYLSDDNVLSTWVLYSHERKTFSHK
jgi:CARDB